MRAIAVLALTCALLGAQTIIMSNGTPPLTGGLSIRYNDQYNGSNGQPNNGRSTYGDSGETAWGADGTIYTTFGDGYGFQTSNVGCIGSSIIIGKFTGSAPYLNGSNANCLTNFGTIAETGIGVCSGGSHKPGGVQNINDGQTIGAGSAAVYMWDSCAETSSPFQYTTSTLLYSPNGGVTWCAPGHTGGQCSANGDVPASAQFTGSKEAIIRFVQYEQGAAGSITFDGNNSYIYGVSFYDASPYYLYLMRAARGSNLQLAETWQFYTGAIGGSIATSGSWSSSDASATALITGCNDGHVRYIPGLGYLKTDTYDAAGDMVYYTAPTLTGPWAMAYYETGINPPLYGFPALDLASISQASTSPISLTGWMGYQGSYLGITGNPATNQYSQFWRQIKITATRTGWMIQ